MKLHKVLFIATVMFTFFPSFIFSQTGTVEGVIVDNETAEPLVGANIMIAGTTIGAASDMEGNFIITNVPPGSHTVEARFLGYRTSRTHIVVQEGETVEITIRLVSSALQLDEILVTGQTREVRRREIGASIATIRTEELQMAPIQSMSQLLQARAAGVNVQVGSGKVGQGTRVVLRGPGSLSMGIQPIIYVDGVRKDNSVALGIAQGGFSWSGLDDINPADIERIEVVRGAAAATLYGTEASSGIIQIFTRTGRGEVRPSSWNYHSQVGFNRTPLDWWNISVYSQWFHENYVRSGFYQQQQLSTRGALRGFNYYAGLTYRTNEGALPNNQEEYYAFRGNLQLLPRDNMVINVNTGYSQRVLQNPNDANNIYGFSTNLVLRGLNRRTPEEIMSVENILKANRFTGGITTEYTPFRNFTNRLVLGVDIFHGNTEQFLPYGGIAVVPFGRIQDYRREATVLTFEYSASWTTNYRERISFATTAGFQFSDRSSHRNRAEGYDFPFIGLRTVNAAAVTYGFEWKDRVKTAGFFAQQRIGFDDLVFLTFGLRADGHSAFGDDHPYQLYPSVGVSYVISDHNFFPARWGELRLKAAYGTAGRQPGMFDAVRTWTAISAEDGEPAVTPANIGNPNLAPEVTHEYEGGFEASLFRNRLNIDFTYYHQVTKDALLQVLYPPSLGVISAQMENAAEVENRGIELAVGIDVLQIEPIRWSVRGNFSTNRNRIVHMADVPQTTVQWTQFNRPGYPIGSFFADVLVGVDDEGNRIIEEDKYIGPAFPTRNIQLSTNVTLYRNLNINLLFEHAGGHYVESSTMRWLALFTVPPGDAIAPHAAGKRAGLYYHDPEDPVLRALAEGPFIRGNSVQPADYWRLRELTLSYNIPARYVRDFGLRNAAVYMSGRNLWRWFKSDFILEAEGDYNTGNDLTGQEFFTTPLPQQFVFGVTLGF